MAVEEITRSLVAGQFATKLFDKDECSKSITNLRRPLTCRPTIEMCSFSSPIFFLSILRLAHQANLSIAGSKYLLLSPISLGWLPRLFFSCWILISVIADAVGLSNVCEIVVVLAHQLK